MHTGHHTNRNTDHHTRRQVVGRASDSLDALIFSLPASLAGVDPEVNAKAKANFYFVDVSLDGQYFERGQTALLHIKS